MRDFLFFVAFVLGSVVAARSSRIAGGFQTVIEQYPFSASLLLHSSGNNFRIVCGSSIINNRAVISAAHCFHNAPAPVWRLRVGSTNAHSGGVVHSINRIIIHPNYRPETLDSDIVVLHSSTVFAFGNTVRPGSIAGANFNVPDNTPVWAIGWGALSFMGNPVEQLRHVQVMTVNQALCRSRYLEMSQVTDNMLCSGLMGIAGRGQCRGDAGSPLLYGNVIIGITSWGYKCGQPNFPMVNVRVSRFTSWIVANA